MATDIVRDPSRRMTVHCADLPNDTETMVDELTKFLGLKEQNMTTLKDVQHKVGSALWCAGITGVHRGIGKMQVKAEDGTEFTITIEGGADE